MRCRICSKPQKNTRRHESWVEKQLCRICSQTVELFSWNGSYISEYWSNEK